MGFGIFSSPNTNAIMGSVDKRFLGTASATVGTMRVTGQMLSMGIATMVIHIFIGNDMITPANHHLFLGSMKVSLIIFSVMCFAGIFASIARGRQNNFPKKPRGEEISY
jgi:hypothetical protein